MFRTVFITKGQYLTVKDEWLLINYGDIACGNKIMKVHNAVDKYIASLTTAIDNADVNKLIIPIIGEKFV